MQKLISNIVSILAFINSCHSGKISFCDGEELITKTEKDCSFGFHFNNRIPGCVCLEGIYRIMMNNCARVDGFAEKVCMKVANLETSSSIQSLELSQNLQDWNRTGVVLDKLKSKYSSWDLMTEFNKAGVMKENSFYVINGLAFAEGKSRKNRMRICVRPARLPKTMKVCQYHQVHNKRLWNSDEVEIFMSKKCRGEKLSANNCFAVLKEAKSECSLSCTDDHNQRDDAISRGKHFVRNQFLDASNPNSDQMSLRKHYERKFESMQRTLGFILNKKNNNSNPYMNYDYINKYLNRRLLISTTYRRSEYNFYEENYIDGLEDLASIAQKFCPSEFVDPKWIKRAVDLFNFMALEEPDNAWFKLYRAMSYLKYCKESIAPITLFAKNTNFSPIADKNSVSYLNSTCNNEKVAKALGFCDPKNKKDSCDAKPVKNSLDTSYLRLHYIPEIVWKLVDLSQPLCYHQFNDSYRSFHIIEQHFESLFTHRTKNLWYHPNWTKKIKSWLLGTEADVQLHNLEVCVASAYRINPILPRLVRPVIRTDRKRRSIGHRKNKKAGKRYKLTGKLELSCNGHPRRLRNVQSCATSRCHTIDNDETLEL